jgi:ribonuclease HI
MAERAMPRFAKRDGQTDFARPKRRLNMEKTIHIFTDGSAIRNPGPGGWAAVLIRGSKSWEMSGASPWTTISEMELVAAVEALRSLPPGSLVELRSDSELLIHGMRFRVFRWQGQGWRNSRGMQVQSQHLWSELLRLNELMDIRWRWIRGHCGHPVQTRVDALAYRAARTQMSDLRRAA